LGAPEKYSRYRWKEGREKDLWSFVDGKVKAGASVTSALKEYGKRHNMSWLTARWKYYQVRKRESLMSAGRERDPEIVGMEIVEAPNSGDDDFISCLSEFVSSSREYGQDVLSMMRGLSRMASLSRESARLQRERDARADYLRSEAEALREVRVFLAEWLSRSQVDRVATLKEFSDRLGAEIERLGALEERLVASQ